MDQEEHELLLAKEQERLQRQIQLLQEHDQHPQYEYPPHKDFQFQHQKNLLFFGFNRDVHESGSTIEGVLQQDEMHISDIQIRWEGKEFTNWYQGRQLDEHCSAGRIIFSKLQTIWSKYQILGPESTQHDGILKRGTHTWPICWEIPEALPSSFQDDGEDIFTFAPWVMSSDSILPRSLSGSRSHIRYYATVSLMQDSHPVLSTTSDFHIVHRFHPETIDLSPVTKEESQWFFFNRQPLKASMTLPFGPVAFSGRRLPLSINMDNATSRRADNISILLYQKIDFHAQQQVLSRTIRTFAAMVKPSSVNPGSKLVKDILLEIPETTPPSCTGILIQRSYELVLQFFVSMTTMTIKMPIQIFVLLQPPDYPNLAYYPPNAHPVRNSVELGTQTYSDDTLTQTGNELATQTENTEEAPQWSEVAVEAKSINVPQEPSNAPVT